MLTLEKKIRNKSARIGIIGLGYVGLPLSLTFCEAGFKVLGIDTDTQRVDSVNQGRTYIIDVSSERLSTAISKDLLQATTDQSSLKDTDVICICVPTPITKTKEPDLSYVIYEAKEISKYIQKGQLIVLESTTYPGTTRQVVLPILESSKLRAGIDFYLAFSPERVDPGNKRFNIKNTARVIGGINQQSTELAELLYSQIADCLFPVSCPEVAELTKIFENVFRSVNIALANELARLCHKMNVSVWEVIEAASTKPFGYMPFYPGPGVGGHCIPLDPYYLSHKAREFDFHTRFIELATEINEEMPYYVVSCIMDALNAKGKSLRGASIFLLGVAYKRDVEDIRESVSLKLVQLLKDKGANLIYNDPYVPQVRLGDSILSSVPVNKENLSSVDCVVIATDHSCYNMDEIIAHSKLIFDTRGATGRLKYNNVVRLGE